MAEEPTRFQLDPPGTVDEHLKVLFHKVSVRDKKQKEFLQAFEEVLHSLKPVFERNPKYLAVMETISEPERAITFRVPWMDHKGIQRVNRGYRVQFSSILGPYMGGLRFHPTVNMGVVKFLGLQQLIQNSLTGLPMGGAAGGSDFDPSGKTDTEILNFCTSFMSSLYRHIGPTCDVPFRDIGVGEREIGYLYGQYKRLTGEADGVLTGRSIRVGGSFLRPEATGYGIVYFAQSWCEDNEISLEGARCLISGSGNVAQYTVEKLLQLGAIPLTLSDSSGFVYEPNGFTVEKLERVKLLKNSRRGRIYEYARESSTAKFFPARKPWTVTDTAVIAFPCATQNEIEAEDVDALATAGIKLVVEGAHMASTKEAIEMFKPKGIILCPGKAANAGGAVVSGLEIVQNSSRATWSREEVDAKLKEIMTNIYKTSKEAAEKYADAGNIHVGANIAGFLKVADAVIEQGCV